MPNANWSNPQLTSTYTNFVSEVKNRDEDLALQFDGTTSTNLPTNTIRWDSSANRWKKWNGTSWAELASTYALTALSTTGAATIGTTLGVTGTITGSSTVTGTALVPSGSSIPVNGVYLPSANSVAIATNSAQRLAIDSSGNISIPGALSTTGTNTAASFIPTSSSVPTNGVYLPSANSVAISTNGTGRLFVDASGNVGVGTNPSTRLHVSGEIRSSSDISNSSDPVIYSYNGSTAGTIQAGLQLVGSGQNIRVYTAGSERVRLDSSGRLGLGTLTPQSLLSVQVSSARQLNVIKDAGDDNLVLTSSSPEVSYNLRPIELAGNKVAFSTGASTGTSYTERMVITDTGAVGIGTAVPSELLHLSKAGNLYLQATNTSTNVSAYFGQDSGGTYIGNVGTGSSVRFTVNNNEAARFDTSSRFLVGTSTARSNFYNTTLSTALQIEGTGFSPRGSFSVINNDSSNNPPYIILGRSKTATIGSNTALANGDRLGDVSFQGTNGTGFVEGASIGSYVDGTVTTSAMPSRLVFSTTADGASAPTERFRISNDGSFSSVIPGGSTLYPRFGCRAWVNFNGTGTVAIRASGNVSSITDNGTGDYTVNFTTAMADANYSTVANAASGTSSTAIVSPSYSTAPATGSHRIGTYNTAGSLNDYQYIFVAIFR